jgi:hypothetical protein
MRSTRRPQPAVLLLLLALLLTSCGGSKGKTEAEGDVSVGDDSFLPTETTTTTAPPATTAPQGATATTRRPATPASTSTTVLKRSTATTTAITPPPPPPTTGGPFPALALQSGTSSIVFQILQQPGTTPSADALAHATSIFQKVSGKPIRTENKPIPGGDQNQKWTHGMVAAAADKYGSKNDTGADAAYMRILYVRGRAAESDAILGFAFGDTLVMFPDQIASGANPVVTAASIERCVMTHELGHSFGLVDLYLKTGRQDPDHPGHSPNKKSVMYWAVDSLDVSTVFQGGPPDDFDAADYADFANIKAGAKQGSKG